MSMSTNFGNVAGGFLRRKSVVFLLLALLLGLWLVYVAFKWTVMRVYVPPGEALLVVNKFGDELPAGRIVVPAGDDDYKGVREEVLGPGRYFFNPLFHDTAPVPLVEIPAGQPDQWEWDPDGNIKNRDKLPMVGLVTLNETTRTDGTAPPPGQEVVDAGFKGVQKQVLSPGTYKINPKQKTVKLEPAVVVPPGSVGVVTRLVTESGGAAAEVESAALSLEPPAGAAQPAGPATRPTTQPGARLVVGPNARGVLKDVLQPGIYYLNPRMAKVTVMPVGYDEITLEAPANPVRFLSSDGYQVEVDLTVVWGRAPADVPNIVATIGTTDDVRIKVVEQAIRAACQNEGASYGAQELIEGKTREEFQIALSAALEREVASRHIHILLALVRNIQIKDAGGNDTSESLLATIQRANIEIERELTNRQKTQTATKKAEYETALKLIDVARQEVASETDVKVANVIAEGDKQAAEIDAERELKVAEIQAQVAALDAQRILILGKADAEVARLTNEAEAKGAKMLVDAFGSPAAYNQYVFAKNFHPQELRLIFAGPGTFWTDLKSFQDIGASTLLQQQGQGPGPRVPGSKPATK